MPTPRKSYKKAELEGSVAVNKGRFADRANSPETTGEVGPPPAYLTEAQKVWWNEIADILPPGAVGRSDRLAIAHAARLQQMVWSDPETSASLQAILMNLLSRLGLDAQGRTRLQMSEPQKKKPVSAIDRFNAALPNASDSVQ